MIDKNSQEWKDYCEGLLKFDDHFNDGVFMIPADPKKDFQVDWLEYRKFIKEKYDGDSSLATQEEKARFIIEAQHRKTA